MAVIIGDYSLANTDDYDTTDDTPSDSRRQYDTNEKKAVDIPVYSISGRQYGDVIAVMQQRGIDEDIAVQMQPGKLAVSVPTYVHLLCDDTV